MTPTRRDTPIPKASAAAPNTRASSPASKSAHLEHDRDELLALRARALDRHAAGGLHLVAERGSLDAGRDRLAARETRDARLERLVQTDPEQAAPREARAVPPAAPTVAGR